MFIVPIAQMPSISELQAVPNMQASGPSIPFAQVFEGALNNLKEAQAVSNIDAYNLAMGNVDDLHTVVINSEKAATALELTVQLTTRVVGAYNDIMRMQV